MNRLLFKKAGKAKFISHLDLMRTMQRAFIRAGVEIRHTEGFNPHPYMNFALPLSVGTESVCELMDFELTGGCPLEEVAGRLNRSLPEGLEAVSAYSAVRKFKEIKWLDIEAALYYDNIVEDAGRIREIFSRDELVIEKKTKRSTAEVNIIPMIRSVSLDKPEGGRIVLRATVAAQDPGLSPAQLVSAIGAGGLIGPDFAKFKRLELRDITGDIFR